MSQMTRAFLAAIERFAEEEKVPILAFEKGVRKDEVAQEQLARFDRQEGVVFIGKAQEKATVYRTVKRRCAETGKTYPWLMKSTAMVNQYYFYCVDKDFGPFFLKFCSYFPYNARLYLNGHEYAKRQLQREGIGFEALDNGVLSCDDPQRLQGLCNRLSASKIDGLLRKWLARLPHPFTAADRRAGFRYELSILQAEFSLTQVVDRPLSGRVFFERVIHDNLDLGRPDHVQLIFARRIQRNTKRRFRTRVITEHVIPSLRIDYKSSTIGQQAFEELTRPMEVRKQRASGLRFGDPVVLAVMTALLMFRLLPRGFSNQDLRAKIARLLVRPTDQFTPGQMSYQLRRLRLRGLIDRCQGTHRYRLTECGLRTALFYLGSHARIIRPLSAALSDSGDSLQHRLLHHLHALLNNESQLTAAA